MICEVKRPSVRVAVYKNRVEISKRSFWFIFWNKITIPIRNIANVDYKPATQVLKIQTNDGKEHKLRLGGWQSASKVRDAILSVY